MKSVAVALGLLVLTACGGSSAPAATSLTPSGPPSNATASQPITVFAAASLKEVFTELGKEFRSSHPGAVVTFSFAGSQTLVAQIQQGAPADLLATADAASATAVATKLVGPPTILARNQLAIVVAPGNPLRLTTLADLAKPSVKVVLAGPTVPAGKAARKALLAAGVTVKQVSDEPDVKAVVAKVRLGEADAGIAYVTDARAAKGAVTGIDLPGISNVYPAALLKAATHVTTATEFLAFLVSPAGQAVFRSYGFLPAA